MNATSKSPSRSWTSRSSYRTRDARRSRACSKLRRDFRPKYVPWSVARTSAAPRRSSSNAQKPSAVPMSRQRLPATSGQGIFSASGRRSQAPGVVPPSGRSMTCHHSATTNPDDRGLHRAEQEGARFLRHLAGDHEALDLLRALVDLRDLRVAHEALGRILLDVAVAAEDLHGLGRGVH